MDETQSCGSLKDPVVTNTDASPTREDGETLLKHESSNVTVWISPIDGDKSSLNDLDVKNEDDITSPDSTHEDFPHDLLRIVKHKPSAIVFSDFDPSAENPPAVFSDESPKASGGSSSSSTAAESEEVEEEEEEEDNDDDFPEASQYKEFLVSRRRRNSSRNRKCSRKRQDAQPSSTCGWQKTTTTGRSGDAGSEDRGQFAGGDEEIQQDNGKEGPDCDSMTRLMKKLDHINNEIRDASSSHSDSHEQDGEQPNAEDAPVFSSRMPGRSLSLDQSRASDKPEAQRRRSRPLTRSQPLTRSSLSSPTHFQARRARVAGRMSTGSPAGKTQ
ncbi:uncharacterized protein [Eucyclogobius newberryi]|uniref:uncharacterized protein n=1 Tax=Eucyclogobius newberryi TaxID=166745 RepID=UPI003B5ABDD4